MKKIIVVFLAVMLACPRGFSREEHSEVRVFNVGPEDQDVAAEIFNGLKSPDGTVTVHSASGKIVVIDHPENLRRMEAARMQVDPIKKAVRLDILEVGLSDWFIDRIGLSKGVAVFSPEEFKPVPYMIKGSERSDITGEFITVAQSGKPAFINVSQERFFGGTVVRRHDGIRVIKPSKMEAGTSLEIIPSINRDGTITVSVYPVLSEYTGDDIAHGRALLSRVTLNSGETFFFGGLDAVRTQAAEDGIPFRGGYGWGPFSSKQSDLTRCLFITVRIEDDLRRKTM